MKKMTDNEIIKALECCVGNKGCDDCPLYAKESCFVVEEKALLDLINRQKAENERLNKKIKIIKFELKYYLATNEESGVVFFPKYSLDNLLKEMEEEE